MRKLPLPPSGPIVTHGGDVVCEIDHVHGIPRANARIDGRDQANNAARNCNLLASKTFNNYNLMGAMRCPSGGVALTVYQLDQGNHREGGNGVMLFESTSKYVSTSEAAKALGLGVSTIKRWVDDGVLPAHKTAGGHRKLLVADVLELVRRGELPNANLAQLMDRRRGPKLPTASELAEELRRALLTGDADRVRLLIVGSYRRGVSIEDLADQAIAPAMERIGHEWETGRIDVMEEHRASQLCAAALYELKPILEERASKNRPRAVGGAPEHDYSYLPTLLAQMVLLDAGWEAVNLGPNTPFKSLAKAIRELRPRLLWLSVSHMGPEEDFVRGYRELYRQCEKAGVAVAIGGNALVEPVRSKIPYTTYGDTLSHLAAFARTLHPRPSQPRRGRPRTT